MVHETQPILANRLVCSDLRHGHTIECSTNAASRNECCCLFVGRSGRLVISSSIRSPGAGKTFCPPPVGQSCLPCRQSKELASRTTFVLATNVLGGNDAV